MRNEKFSKIMLFFVLLSLFFSVIANAKVDQINPKKGMPRKELTKIRKEIERLEPMVVNWTPTWSYNVPKEDIEKKLIAYYQELDNYSSQYPDNLELALFKGLVAHYAYNLDLKEYYQLAIKSFQQAAAIDSTDYRVDWYWGVHLVKSNNIKAGMEKLQSVKNIEPNPKKLPFSYWEDFAYCSLIARMPSHVLLGVERAKQTKTKRSKDMLNTLAQHAANQLKEPPQDSQLGPDQVWTVYQDSDHINYRNRIFGFTLQVPASWLAEPTGCQNNSAAIFIIPPTKKGLTGEVSSTMLLLARWMKAGEDINDFLSEVLDPRYSFKEVQSDLNWEGVKAYQGTAEDVYSDEAGARNCLIAFSRKEPEQPGLLLEFPVELNQSDSEAVVSYYRSEDEYTRFSGEIYYLLILDTTDSVYEEAKEEFDLVIKNLIVE
ncbi:MAG: hypothetical protein GXY86_13410 [Firmicutes bacterium]|nr:hypothetical protein [Bacillota bacterium]